MDIWKISKNSDTATQDALTGFDVFVNMTTPSVKSRWVNNQGINGSIDLTEALGGVNYSDREIALILITQQSAQNVPYLVDEFLNTYVGEKIRLYNTTQGYMLVGRITDVATEKPKGEESYKLICNVVCEPLRYAETYTPSASGLDITPAALGANLWNTTNVMSADTSAATVTSSGGTIVAGAPYIEGEGNEFIVTATSITGSGKLMRFYLQTFVNCDVEVRHNGKVVGRNSNTVLIYTDGGQITINVFRKVLGDMATFECNIREIAAHTVYNDTLQSVPFTVSHAYSSGSESKPKLYINGTVINLDYADAGVWDEYAPAIIKRGDNIIAAFVNNSSFDPSSASGSIKIRYRKGAL